MSSIKFGPCPKCRERGMDTHGDNMGTYPDGHGYCFSCGFYQPGKGDYQPKEIISAPRIPMPQQLPQDHRQFLPEEAEKWLTGFGLTTREIIQNRISWSPGGIWTSGIWVKPLLCFPILDQYNKLLMWQARNFGKLGPKYLTMGNKEEILHVVGQGNVIVLVEDLVSAIKVGRLTSTMPLLGSTLSLEKARRLASITKHIVVWLDPGAETLMRKLIDEISPYFDSVGGIYSRKDPKDHTDIEIRSLLEDYMEAANS